MENVVVVKSKNFAIRIIKLYKYLVDNKKEFVLSKQILKSGTSIGANIRESKNAQSNLDFINKLSIALKEADETAYWLELLSESSIIDQKQFDKYFEVSVPGLTPGIYPPFLLKLSAISFGLSCINV